MNRASISSLTPWRQLSTLTLPLSRRFSPRNRQEAMPDYHQTHISVSMSSRPLPLHQPHHPLLQRPPLPHPLRRTYLRPAYPPIPPQRPRMVLHPHVQLPRRPRRRARRATNLPPDRGTHTRRRTQSACLQPQPRHPPHKRVGMDKSRGAQRRVSGRVPGACVG